MSRPKRQLKPHAVRVEHVTACPRHPQRWARVALGDRRYVECTCAWDRAQGRT